VQPLALLPALQQAPMPQTGPLPLRSEFGFGIVKAALGRLFVVFADEV
jgi:hypothetical protein